MQRSSLKHDVSPRIAGSMLLLLLASGVTAAQTQSVVLAAVTADTALAPYTAQEQVTGVIRNYGFGLGGVLQEWEAGFRKLHPGISFDDHLPTSDAAMPALITGVTDLAPDGGEATLTETLAFYETYGYHVASITVATGAYDVEGRSNGIVVFVNKDNPIDKLTLAQLDGIFGAERNAGMRGFQWTPTAARTADHNIRTWGQLGLTHEWAKQPIQTFGHAPSGTTRFFQLKVLNNSDKWNPNFREYVETGSKMIADEDRSEQRLGVKFMLANELAKNRYGIGWTVLPQARGIDGIKPVALAAREGGPYVMPSRASFQDRSYPLARSIYIFINRAPGKPLAAKVREFLRYALSREGQEIVARNGNYLPLTAQVAAEQLRKLD